jgi:hypothetical protein
LVLAAALLSHGSAAAYGKASQPLAQVAFSGNCDNPSFPFCAPPPGGVGTGGIWFWIEVDAGGGGDIRGAECGHTVGGAGGPGGAGAVKVSGDITWTYSNRVNGVNAGAESFPGLVDPGDRYYLITLPGGENKFLFPTTTGHYAFQPAPGVSLQLTIAP